MQRKFDNLNENQMYNAGQKKKGEINIDYIPEEQPNNHDVVNNHFNEEYVDFEEIKDDK